MKTDEETAENFYYKTFPVTLNFGEEERKKNVMDIFLAGLEAGKDMAEADLATIAYMQGAERYKPQWHDVAGGDLPPEDTKVLALMADKEIHIAHFYRKNVWDKIGIVIAWCEIPTFDEE